MRYFSKKKTSDEPKIPLKQKMGKALKSRAAKRGTLALVLTLVFVALIVLLNVVMIMLAERYPALNLDLTANQIYELQAPTIEYIKGVGDDVTVNVLAEEDLFKNATDPMYSQCWRLLKQFNQYNEKIKIKYISLTENPTFQTNYPNINWDSTNTPAAIVESGEDYTAIGFADFFTIEQDSYTGSTSITGSNVEQSVTKAILNVTDKNKVKVAFAVGLGGSTDMEAYYSQGIRNLLADSGYEIEDVTLGTSQALPEGCKLVIICLPAVDITLEAKEQLSTYLENNGNYGTSLLYIPAPEPLELPNLESLTESWGMKPTEGYIYELDETKSNPLTFFRFAADYGTLFKDTLKNSGVAVDVYQAMPIEITDETLAQPLLTSSERSGVIPFTAEDTESFDYEGNVAGSPLNVAVAGIKQNENGVKSHLITWGSYYSVSQSAFEDASNNNKEYFLNMCNTLTGKGDTVTVDITSKSSAIEYITVDAASGNAVRLIFMWIIPLAVLAIALVVYFVRRHK
ncbi:MAG: GldG family protein [Oscillospiraceae bacterium]|jgi:hypothetical protein|nr:GldG family protein [Oscillospiraceae bacterium]